MKHSLVALVVLTLVAALGCKDEPYGKSCMLDSDCKTGVGCWCDPAERGADGDCKAKTGTCLSPEDFASKQAAATPSAPAEAPAKEPEVAKALETRMDVLEALGYTIEIPTPWTLETLENGASTFRIPSTRVGGVTQMSRLDVSSRSKAPASADAIAEDCTGTVVEKQTEESGAIYAICELVAAGQPIRSLTYYIPGDAPILCEGSGGDVSAMLAACRSLRKKG